MAIVKCSYPKDCDTALLKEILFHTKGRKQVEREHLSCQGAELAMSTDTQVNGLLRPGK
jgi:hypothetical protein